MQLGALAIPTYNPAVLLIPSSSDEQWLETLASSGTVRLERRAWELRDFDVHRKLSVHVFPVTYANTASAQQSILFNLAVLDLAGRLEDDLGDVTRTVAANGQSTVIFSWDGRTVPLGRYQLVATVTADGGVNRKAVEMIEIKSRTRGPVRHPSGRVSP